MADPLSTIVSAVTDLLKFAVLPINQQLSKGFAEPGRLMDLINANTDAALASLFAIPDAYRGNLGSAPDRVLMDRLRALEVALANHLVSIKRPQDLSPQKRALIRKAADDVATEGYEISEHGPIRYLFVGRACGAAMVGFVVAKADSAFVSAAAGRYLDFARKASGPLAAALTSARSDAAGLEAEVNSWPAKFDAARWGIFFFGGGKVDPEPSDDGHRGSRRPSWNNTYGDITGSLSGGFSGSHQTKIGEGRENQDERALFPGGGSYDQIQQRINGMSGRYRTAKSAEAALASHPKANETVAADIGKFIAAVP